MRVISTQFSPKLKKSITYTGFILLVLTVFLLGYFFYFIPKNRQTIHNNGFVILKTIIANIKNKTEGRKYLYSNFYKNVYNDSFLNKKNKITLNSKNVNASKVKLDSISNLLEENNIRAKFKYDTTKSVAKFTSQIINPGNNRDSIISKLNFEKEDFVFSVEKMAKNDSLIFYEAAEDFLQPILSTQKDELFGFYALLKIEGKESKLLYHDEEFGIRTDATLDTLLPKNLQAYFTDIRDISSRGTNYKMFYYPFEVDGAPMVLYGFVETSAYEGEMRKVPFVFVYPLAIAFMLLLFFLPILKFYIMDANERVTVIDVALFGLSIFMGVSLLTLVTIQFFLWQGEEGRAREKLQELGDEIERTFLSELTTVYSELEMLEIERATWAKKLNTKVSWADSIGYINLVQRYLECKSKGDSNYYLFDRISWVNKDGVQVIKSEVNGKPVYTNVKRRKYFTDLQSNKPFSLTNNVTATTREFSWEPIYSWTNGDFNISIAKKTGDLIEVIATKMYSVVNTITPVGYGFCIIDPRGNVQVHSDVKRNLRENFFEKAEPSVSLRGIVAARQDTSLNDVVMYGKWHIMHIHPVKNLPLTLVAFYDKGSIFPINLRILIFALLFSIIFAVICTILWLILGRTGFKNYPLVYSPMDCLTWLTPQKNETDYYHLANIFLIVYASALIASSFFYNSSLVSNFSVFSIVLITPVNIVFVLYILRRGLVQRTIPDKTGTPAINSGRDVNIEKVSQQESAVENKRIFTDEKPIMITALHLLITVLYFMIFRMSLFSSDSFFLLFQLACIAWIWIYRSTARKYNDLTDTSKNEANNNHRYLQRYSVMVTLLIVCLAVLPGALFSWYAYNQENIQKVKKQQLHLLNDITERSDRIMRRNGVLDSSGRVNDKIISFQYLEKLLFEKGIYKMSRKDSISFNTSNLNDCISNFGTESRESYDNFYFTIAEAMGTPYHDPRSYPALKDFASDSAWAWKISDNTLHFWSCNNLPLIQKPGEKFQELYMGFEMPERFRFLKNGGLFFMILLVAISLWGLYKWLKSYINNIFLLKFSQSIEAKYDNKKHGLIQEFYNKKSKTGFQIFKFWNKPANKGNEIEEKAIQSLYSAIKYREYITSIDPVELSKFENELLREIKNGQDLYSYIWKKCSDKEKYLLFDFATDGLINYKNNVEIYNLIANGIFVRDENLKIRLFSPAFRAYILTKTDDEEIILLHKKFNRDSTWQAIKGPLLLLLLGFAGVVFFTQEATFQKFIALAGGLGTLISLVPKFFSISASKNQNENQ